jgi:hypothetical protein
MKLAFVAGYPQRFPPRWVRHAPVGKGAPVGRTSVYAGRLAARFITQVITRIAYW